jgi:hypothetical protein
VVSDYFLDFHGVFCYLPFCISDFTDLGFLSPNFSQVWQGSVNLTYFFKEPAFCFIDSSYVLKKISISLIRPLFLLFLSSLFWDLLVFAFLVA